ncbi:ABC transporter ATP-binding protein [Clostridium sp. BL-8]|uniref:ABC transporter ATP-binding protein n=1 Tax=Clostridium sp. BL-8 TaxID=349938 RepID=UPI00098C0B62|nr:ABC transporter ATP-binding protein [Clostridium sp. BL-8]OOM78696.1 spermidine/putrescine import ATP-binding protein PotA [Clostridium sp. BL-8]
MQLRIEGIKKSFNNVQALESINLIINKGSFTTLLGPSGCGKTTLLRCIAGLEEPDEGEIYMGEECLFSREKKINKAINLRNFGMVFQDFALWPHMTVFENIAFGLRATGQKKDLRKRVMEAIDMVRLQGMEKRFPHELSGGQQQRVAFARAVVLKPQLVLFDEPLSALDAILREEMRLEIINLVHNIGSTAIYVTHDQSEALTMSDEIVVMNKGTILQNDTPENVYNKPMKPFVARFIGKSNWLIKNKRLVRPEHIHLKYEGLGEEVETHDGVVKTVSYLGDRYEILVEVMEAEKFLIYSSYKIGQGEKIKLFIKKKDIYEIEG